MSCTIVNDCFVFQARAAFVEICKTPPSIAGTFSAPAGFGRAKSPSHKLYASSTALLGVLSTLANPESDQDSENSAWTAWAGSLLNVLNDALLLPALENNERRCAQEAVQPFACAAAALQLASRGLVSTTSSGAARAGKMLERLQTKVDLISRSGPRLPEPDWLMISIGSLTCMAAPEAQPTELAATCGGLLSAIAKAESDKLLPAPSPPEQFAVNAGFLPPHLDSLLWPAREKALDSNPGFGYVCAFVETVLEREAPTMLQVFAVAVCPLELPLRRWWSQSFWGVLPLAEALLVTTLPLVYGIDHAAYVLVCMFEHATSRREFNFLRKLTYHAGFPLAIAEELQTFIGTETDDHIFIEDMDNPHWRATSGVHGSALSEGSFAAFMLNSAHILFQGFCLSKYLDRCFELQARYRGLFWRQLQTHLGTRNVATEVGS